MAEVVTEYFNNAGHAPEQTGEILARFKLYWTKLEETGQIIDVTDDENNERFVQSPPHAVLSY